MARQKQPLPAGEEGGFFFPVCKRKSWKNLVVPILLPSLFRVLLNRTPPQRAHEGVLQERLTDKSKDYECNRKMGNGGSGDRNGIDG